jgi:diguanylate cyclase
MLELSEEQIRAAIAQLDQALYHHEQWHKNLLRSLVAQLPPDAADLVPDAHGRCRFGQWYESGAADPLRDQPAFAALREAHRQMHENAAALLQRSADGLAIPVNDLDQFTNLLDRMRLEIQSLRNELSETSQNRDPLTGARNRTRLLSDLREQQALVRRGVHGCVLVMMDLDHFKAVNDKHGHAAGDAVLAKTVERLREELRPYDHIYRVGGEEFLLLMPQIDVDAALGLAERFRAAIAASPIHCGDGELHVTASLGVARLDGTRPVEQSIDLADKALYEAKVAGRNRVVTSP